MPRKLMLSTSLHLSTLAGLFLEFSKLMMASGSWVIETANFEDKEKTCKEIINANIYRFARDIKNFVKKLILLKKKNYKRYTFLHLCCSSLLWRMSMRSCIDEQKTHPFCQAKPMPCHELRRIKWKRVETWSAFQTNKNNSSSNEPINNFARASQFWWMLCWLAVHGNFLLKAMFFKDAKKKNFFCLIFMRARWERKLMQNWLLRTWANCHNHVEFHLQSFVRKMRCPSVQHIAWKFCQQANN